MDDLPLVEALVSSLAEVGVQVKQWLQSRISSQTLPAPVHGTTCSACDNPPPTMLPMLSGVLCMGPRRLGRLWQRLALLCHGASGSGC